MGIAAKTFSTGLPPIGVFAYNRPRHLRTCLEAIRRSEAYAASQYPLFIFCDAPKHAGHAAAVEETQLVAKQWPAAQVIVREHNQGFHNITEGIAFLCKTYGRAIIIEDDVMIAPDFLPFLTQALDRYQEDSRVFMISGFMYFDAHPLRPETFFLPSSFIWGWGTWERAWQQFSWGSEGWEAFLQSKKNRREFDCLGTAPFSKMLRKAMQGECNTWDIQWMYAIARAQGLCLYPSQTLTWNCGVGGGTHGNNSTHDQDPLRCSREHYIHGNLTVEDFLVPRLPEGNLFPQKTVLDRKAVRLLAIRFLKQRWREKKKFSLAIKIAYHWIIGHIMLR